MEKLKALIIDDEKFSRENIISLITEYCVNIEVVGEAGSVKEAKNKFEELEPNVLFLDINMPKESGFDLLELLQDRNFMVVFATAHNEYGIQAVKADAIDYLLKPIDVNELQATEKKLIEKWEYLKVKPREDKRYDERQKIIINHSYGFSIIEIGNIIRLEAASNYTKIFLNNKSQVISSKTLKEFEEILDEKYFCRIHKSYLINLKFLKEYSNINGGTALMVDGSQIVISRRKYQEFMDKLKDFTLYIK